MPPDGNDIVARTPDGVEHRFPAGTPDAVIDGAIKKHLNVASDTRSAAQRYADQQGLPLDVAERHIKSWPKAQDMEYKPPTTFGGKVWDQTKGGIEAVGDLAAAVPRMFKTMGSFLPENASAMLSEQERPTAPADVQGLVGPQVAEWQKADQTGGIESLGHRGAALLPFAGPMAAQSGEAFGRGEVGRGLVDAFAALMARPRIGGGGGEGIRSTAQEVLGEGSFKAKSLSYQHANAMRTQEHLSGVADAVHTDAQQAMSQVLAKVDAAKPEGAFSKADIQQKVGDAVGDLVQVPEKLPPSVAKILKVEKPTWENLAAQKDVSGFVNRLKSSGLSDVEVRETLRGQGFSEREVQNAMTGGEGVSPDALTAEQLKQMRSDVGQELGKYGKKGTVGAALNKVYGVLSGELRGAAQEAGVESDWLTANNKYTQYANDFIRGPIKKSLFGNTASSIMEPLAGSTRTQILDTLQKYRDAGFNVDTDMVTREIGRYGAAKKTLRMAEPGKWDLILAGLSPKAAALRQGVPRLVGSPSTLDRVFGKGAEIPAREVYPSKAAAMKATKSAPSSTPGYKPSEKAATMAAERKSLGPEFEGQQRQEMINRYKGILRNPYATMEDLTEAKARLKELGAVE